jgi:hypothetical protein
MSKDVIFSADPDNSKEKCKNLAANYSQAVDWELKSVSEHSPSIVSSAEYVARQIHSPIHIDGGEIKVTAFTDAFDKGLSVNRFKYASLSSVHLAGEAKAANDRNRDPSRKYCGVVVANVGDIRSVVDDADGCRCFCVYDTALLDAVSHADVCMIRPEAAIDPNKLPKKAQKKERRRRLQKAFGRLQVPS